MPTKQDSPFRLLASFVMLLSITFTLDAQAGEEGGIAAVPAGSAISFQGKLNQNGQPFTGQAEFVFTLHDALTAGILIANATPASQTATVTNGLFTTQIDFGAAAFVSQSARWMSISVRVPPGSGSYTLLSPRERITPAPVALYALNGAGLTLPYIVSAAANSVALIELTNTHAGGGGLYGSGNVYGVFGNTNSSTGVGVWGRNLSSGNFGQLGTQDYGVYGVAVDPTEWGVVGQHNATANIGVLGRSDVGVFAQASSGAGLHARHVNTSNYALLAQADLGVDTVVYGTEDTAVRGFHSATGNYGNLGAADFGVDGVVTGNPDTGVRGFHVPTGNYGELGTFNNGVEGISDSSIDNMTGVYGLNSADSGTTYGVVGRCESPSGRGVFGYAIANTGTTYGVLGRSDSPNGSGVYGNAAASTGTTYGGQFKSDSPSGRGVYGWANSLSGSNYGVYGLANSPDGYAVWAQGRTGASGTKSFRIDHPDDPTNKYLLHYSAESPEVINFYSGKVMLDSDGEAVVEMPHYFAKINKDPRYTLTAVGAPMPMLHVGQEIDESALCAGANAAPGQVAPICSFRIAGGAPWAKVSWRVEALRNDQWARQHDAPVEVDKQDREKGTYQHPELYGQPAELGMNYHPELDAPVQSNGTD